MLIICCTLQHPCPFLLLATANNTIRKNTVTPVSVQWIYLVSSRHLFPISRLLIGYDHQVPCLNSILLKLDDRVVLIIISHLNKECYFPKTFYSPPKRDIFLMECLCLWVIFYHMRWFLLLSWSPYSLLYTNIHNSARSLNHSPSLTHPLFHFDCYLSPH